MRTIFAFLASAMILAGPALGQDQAAHERRITAELSALEHMHEPAQTQPSDDVIRDAAISFAQRIAPTDKRQFVRAFEHAYNAGITLRQLSTGGNRMAMVQPSEDPLDVADGVWSTAGTIEKAYSLILDRQRIVGGQDDIANQFPDCVAVGGPDTWCCSGTLVAPNVVVTAGHCAGICATRVFVGPKITGPGPVIAVDHAVQHPQYGKNGQHNDLTVLILHSDVQGVTPRKLAPSTLIDGMSAVRLVGYGYNDFNGTSGYGTRRLVDVTVVATDCTQAANAKLGCDAGLEFIAGQLNLGKDTCNGDSGGPAYVRDSQMNYFLAGATSRGTNVQNGRPCGDGGIYERLDKFAAWIKSVPGGHWPSN